MTFSFIRPELNSLQAYTPHPGGAVVNSVVTQIDRLDTNESPYDLPIDLKQELAKMWVESIESNRYPDGGHLSLKAEIASYVTESAAGNPQILPSQITVGNGSDELIRSILIATCVGGQGGALVAEPTFSMFGIIAQTLGVPVVSVDRLPSDMSVNLDAARMGVRDRRDVPVRVVFMVHPNSPTGNCLTSDELDWLRSLPRSVLVVIDEAYFEYSHQTMVAELAERPNWIILRTFSKAFRLAAHRVGYAVGDPALIDILERVRLPYNLSSISIAAAHLALKYRASLLATIAETIAERDRLFTTLSNVANLHVWPSHANFIYAQIQGVDNPNLEMKELVDRLKNQGTLIRYTGGGLRISIGSPTENGHTGLRLIFSLDTGEISSELRIEE
jgi:histidinol-phosphate aminotransferase